MTTTGKAYAANIDAKSSALVDQLESNAERSPEKPVSFRNELFALMVEEFRRRLVFDVAVGGLDEIRLLKLGQLPSVSSHIDRASLSFVHVRLQLRAKSFINR